MAQGGLKKSAGPAKKKTHKKQEKKIRKGTRHIAPKQTGLVKERALQKKLTAQINKNIEKQMSVKANAVGKLTIMKSLAEETASANVDKKKRKY
ncbi:hypothetical protein DFQ28_006846 [Apophysomyces sp. BC1034]|nr:hypothetical protein DFQ30_006739 [Apophysomyces sp. BC1015]KAG0176791.1 hypothetical protein DFQ29_005642 [Apophysomyces sp. BC1021]KAG0187114.1 hypothetical protein DFQ28_006846 [Apophysomyces sp. BC1034]